MLNKKVGLIALLVGFAAGEIMAGTLTSYAVGDVLVCFRKSGGANDLVVDAGQISTFTNGTPNQRIPITQYTGGQLALVGTNNVIWSAFTWFDDTVSPNWTLFASRARTSLDTQTAAWHAASATAQQLPVIEGMGTIPPGAGDNLLFNGLNTSTAVIEQDASSGNPNYLSGQSYHTGIDPNGTGLNNFGDFAGNPENTTAANFTTSGTVVRSDFYQIPPTGAGSVKFLGYFELNTNGVMTYVAYPSAVPVFKSISRAGNVNTIGFTTGLYGTYTLRGTNSLTSGTSPANWPAISVLTSGDNSIHTTTDTTTNAVKFYTITAQ